MNKNYDKLRLGATLSAYDGDNNNHGDCFNYGSVGGCDQYCPALLNGKCDIDVVVDVIAQLEKDDNCDDDDLDYIKEMYYASKAFQKRYLWI